MQLDKEEIQRQLNYYLKQKESLTADIFRVEGILMYLQNELNKDTEKNIDNKSNPQ